MGAIKVEKNGETIEYPITREGSDLLYDACRITDREGRSVEVSCDTVNELVRQRILRARVRQLEGMSLLELIEVGD